MTTGPRVGIVVIGRNEARHLPACLESLKTYRGRTIYADSASTDPSVLIAAQAGASVVNIDPSLPLTPARGRNEGFRLVLQRFPDCDFVQFVDGDSVVEEGWIEAAAAFLREHQRVAVVCGHVAEAHHKGSIYNWLCANEWVGPVGRIEACGGNAMIRVAALQEVGGFRGDLVAGEEAELMARMRQRGWEIWRLDRGMVTHDAELLRFPDWWKRTRRGGFAAANVWWITRRSPEPLNGPQMRSPLLWVILWPLFVVVLSLSLRSTGALLLIPIGWLLQTARIASKRNFASIDAWRYAAMIMVARLPEAVGVLSFFSTNRPTGRHKLRFRTGRFRALTSGKITFGLRECLAVATVAIAISILGALLSGR